jgi:hypothetical protein
MGVFSRRLSRVSLLSAIALIAAGAALYVLLFSPTTPHHNRFHEEAERAADDVTLPDEEEWRPTQKRDDGKEKAIKAAVAEANIAAVTLFGVLKDVPDLRGEMERWGGKREMVMIDRWS